MVPSSLDMHREAQAVKKAKGRKGEKAKGRKERAVGELLG
jgi:hypothetical protein